MVAISTSLRLPGAIETSRTSQTSRVESIDLLKGLVMVIMALDHIRDFIHTEAYFYYPTDLERTNLLLFLTRFITNFCAPAFSLLAGVSAYVIGQKKGKRALSGFLLKRGLWLIGLEVSLVTFAWFFDPTFHIIELQVIWALGVSMIGLAALIYLPSYLITAIGLVVIIGHNGLDAIHWKGSILWAMLHEQQMFLIGDGILLDICYPIVPWVGVMAFGYGLGSLYHPTVEASRRTALLSRIGLLMIALFVILRAINGYGDPVRWVSTGSVQVTIMSFLNVSKYPPSLLFLLLTLGVCFVFLAYTERLNGRVVTFFQTFGRVPFFFYLLHLYLIHGLAMLMATLMGYDWHSMSSTVWINEVVALKGFGVNLGGVYLLWLGLIAVLYPFCQRFGAYKLAHKEKWWLSYL